MVEWLPVIISLIVSGMLAGTLAGLLGIGGGIINVPILYFLLQHFGVEAGNAMLIATGTSLATIIPTSISSMGSHHRRGNVDWPLVKAWAPFIIVGVSVGSLLVVHYDGRIFAVIFGLLALFTAFNFGFRGNSAPWFQALPPMPWQGLFGAITGFLSVMVGIGGGTLGVTILSIFNVAIHRAVGTCAAFGLLIALPGALVMLTLATTPGDAPAGTFGYINLPALLILVPLSVLCAPVGVKLGSILGGDKLRKIFAILLALTAIRILLQVL